MSRLKNLSGNALRMQIRDFVSVRRRSLSQLPHTLRGCRRPEGRSIFFRRHFASRRWNRFWQDSTEQFTAELGELWVCFTKLKGPVMKNTSLLTPFLSLQSANKGSTLLRRPLHNYMRHINPPSEMLWITGRENGKALHVSWECTCSITNISSRSDIPE